MTEKTFEAAMAELEQIVEALETGSLPLDKALEKFEHGVRLSRFCFARLDETEKKITCLTNQPDGTSTETPFSSESPRDFADSTDTSDDA